MEVLLKNPKRQYYSHLSKDAFIVHLFNYQGKGKVS